MCVLENTILIYWYKRGTGFCIILHGKIVEYSTARLCVHYGKNEYVLRLPVPTACYRILLSLHSCISALRHSEVIPPTARYVCLCYCAAQAAEDCANWKNTILLPCEWNIDSCSSRIIQRCTRSVYTSMAMRTADERSGWTIITKHYVLYVVLQCIRLRITNTDDECCWVFGKQQMHRNII